MKTFRATYTTKHSTYHVGEATSNTTRHDYYTEDGQLYAEQIFCDGRFDTSPQAVFYMTDPDDPNARHYDGEKCSCCYLNFGHTVREHDKNVNR